MGPPKPPESPAKPASPSSKASSSEAGSLPEEAPSPADNTPEEDISAAAAAAAGIPQPELESRTPPSAISAASPQPSSGSDPGSMIATGLPGSFISAAGDSVATVGNSPFAFDTDMSKYPSSMTSSVRAHVYEGGLRYHAFRDGRYAFPNDEIEQNRDDMKHTMTLMLCRGRHFYSPVEEALENGGMCLDLGTGTGIWVIEVGDKYPKANITGLDLSPIQPNYVPENVHFFVDDFEQDWVDEEAKFDFIHVRHTVHSIHDLPALLKRIYKHLKPGGYVEFQELHFSPQCDDGSLTPSTPYAFRDFTNFIDAGLRALGSELHAIVGLSAEMEAAGFEPVETVTHKCPIGVWPRDKRLRLCGLFMRTAIMDGLRGLSRRPLGTGLTWTPLQIEMFLVDVRKAVMDSKFHAYFPFHVVYGRKPPG